MFGTKKISALTKTELQSLVDREISEGKLIEYKRDLPGSTDADKKEFLFDVSSFANAGGGHLIYGISEEAGIPKQLMGVTVTDADQELRKLQSIILDGVEPRIQGLELRFIPIADSQYVLVIHIPQSWALPHMVIFKGTDKFYSRNSGGKHKLDVEELRSLFTFSSTITEQIRKFRIERISRVVADETPIALPASAKIILHLVPFLAFSSTVRICLATAERIGGDLYPLGTSGYNNRFNLDGLLLHDAIRTTSANSYLQLYHNGVIETVDTSILQANSGEKLIASTFFERKLIQYIAHYFKALQKLGINPPIVIMLTLLNVKGYTMAVSGHLPGGARIDRDVLAVPEIVVDKLEISPRDLKPMLDSVWNAAGWLESKNFDAEGNYTPFE